MTKEQFGYEAIERQKERLGDAYHWFPYPAIITFGLFLVLSGHVLNAINPKVGQPADLIPLNAPEGTNDSFWLSMRIYGDHLIVVTEDRTVFKLPRKIESTADLEGLKRYMDNWVRKTVNNATIAREVHASQLKAVIAADQRLKYLHVRPIINLLAQAGITEYAFETKVLLASSKKANLE